MLLDHPRVGVAELYCDNGERHVAHRKSACIGVAEPMEIDGRIYVGLAASCAERPLLLGFAPLFAVSAKEQASATGLSGCKLGNEVAAFLRQHDVARLAALAGAHPYCAGIRIEIFADHCRELAIAAAGQ